MPNVTEVLLKYAEYGDEGLLPAVEEVFYHGHLAEHLHELEADSDRQTDGNFTVGYKHPNGFIKIRLGELPEAGWTVRLHIWEPGATDVDIHDHRWHFASCVAAGSISEQRYQLTDSGGTSTMFDCSSSLAGEYVLASPRPCGVQLTADDTYRAGDSYQRPADVLHLARAAGAGRAVTFFVQGPATKDKTTVVRSAGRPDISRLPVQPLSQPELKQYLRGALVLMSDA